jgi:hypothetical protein
MAAQTIEVPDDAQLTQYGEAIGGSPGFRNTLRAEAGETEVSLMLGRVDPLPAAMLVTRTPNTFAVVRHCTAGGLRSRGFEVRHTPSPTNGFHVSVSVPAGGPSPAVWDDRLADLFEEALAEERPEL